MPPRHCGAGHTERNGADESATYAGSDPWNYVTREKLAIAVDVLAAGEGKIQDRLLTASCCLHNVRRSDFPAELAGDFAEIESLLMSAGWFAADDNVTLNRCSLTYEQCSQAAGLIVLLFEKVIERTVAERLTSGWSNTSSMTASTLAASGDMAEPPPQHAAKIRLS